MGGKSSTTKTENSPPAWATPLFQQSAGEASKLYNSGSGGNTYLGSTVSPLSGTTMQGVNQLRNAGANWDTGGTRNLFAGIGGQSVSDPFVNQLSGVANSVGNIASGGQRINTEADYRKILGQADDPTASGANLADMASGKYLQEGNPYFNQRLEGQLADTAAQTRSLMSGSGRYGSDVSNRVLTDRLGGLRTEALAQDWDRNLAAMLGANSQIDSANNARIGNQLSAVSGITGVQDANIGNRLSAAGLQSNTLSNAGALRGAGLDRALSSTNAMRGIDQQNFENRLAGAGATLQAGNILDQQDQRMLADEVAKFYALDNQDWNRLGLLQNAAAGSAGPYGTQIATSRQPMDIGGILGGFGKLFAGKSDIRAKENIVRLGEANGIPLYAFSYRGERARWIGTMAQAVPLHRAGALYVDPADGLYGVDYSKLGFPMMRVN